MFFRSLSHPFQQVGQLFQITRIYLQVQQTAFAVEQFVGRKLVNVQVALNGLLLLFGQVEMSYIGSAYVVLLDDVLPRVLRTAVCQIDELDVEVLQSGVLLG